jgi:hypothetical protein
LGFFLADVFELVETALHGGIRWRLAAGFKFGLEVEQVPPPHQSTGVTSDAAGAGYAVQNPVLMATQWLRGNTKEKSLLFFM